MPKNIKITESEIQMQILAYLRSVGVFAFSVPNELLGKSQRSGGMSRMIKFRNMGLTAGVADLICLLPGGRVFFMEVKTPTGRQSENQKSFEDRVRGLGFDYHIARSIEDAKKIMEDKKWKNLH